MLHSKALAFACEMIIDNCNGKSGPISTVGDAIDCDRKIKTNAQYITSLIGLDNLPLDEIAKLLSDVGAQTNFDNNDISVMVPSWRFDLNSPIDLAAETARCYGYEKIDEVVPEGGINISSMPPMPFSIDRVGDSFSQMGFTEIISDVFSCIKQNEILGIDNKECVTIKNPTSEKRSVIRKSLVGGLIDSALHNIENGVCDYRLFEIGRCFNSKSYNNESSDKNEILHVSGIVGGMLHSLSDKKIDFFDVKGFLETFLKPVNSVTFDTKLEKPKFLHPFQSANIFVGKELIGCVGVMHPNVSLELGFRDTPIIFEISLEQLSKLRSIPQLIPVSRFPQIRRDLSVISDLCAEEVLRSVKDAHDGEVVLFDVFEGNNIPSNKK